MYIVHFLVGEVVVHLSFQDPPIGPFNEKLLLSGYLENIPVSINIPFQFAMILLPVPRRTIVNGHFRGRFSGSSDNFRQALSMNVSLLRVRSLVLCCPFRQARHSAACCRTILRAIVGRRPLLLLLLLVRPPSDLFLLRVSLQLLLNRWPEAVAPTSPLLRLLRVREKGLS